MIKIKILVCCHKKTKLPSNPIYLPIQVGKSRSNIDLGIQTDNTINGRICDNISEYNNIYCEMTAAYWAWKNIKILYPDIEYIGLCHYRRFFSDSISQKHKYFGELRNAAKEAIQRVLGKTKTWVYIPRINVSSISDLERKVSINRLEKIIESSDITITSLVKTYNGSVRDLFSAVGSEFITLLEMIVKEHYKDYYNSLNDLLDGKTLAPGNMIIIKYSYYDEYCSFLFGVLSKHIEKTIEIGNITNPYGDSRYSRVAGYLAELLTYTYVLKNSKDLKIQTVDSIFVQNT